MRRILIVEDEFSRIKWFRERFNLEDAILDITNKPGKAIALLKEYQYDLIFLDHDLEDEHYNSIMAHERLERTGQDVADFLATSLDCQEGCLIVVHSLNPVGGARMYDTMRLEGRNVLHVPFLTLMKAEIKL